MFTLTALSGDRFFAIVDPLRKFHSHSGKRATRITIVIAVSIWILAACLGIPAIKRTYIKVIEVNQFKKFIQTLPFVCYFKRIHLLKKQFIRNLS